MLTKLYRNTIMMKLKLRWTVIRTAFQSKSSIFFHFLILSEHFGTIRLRILQCEFFFRVMGIGDFGNKKNKITQTLLRNLKFSSISFNPVIKRTRNLLFPTGTTYRESSRNLNRCQNL